MGGSKGGRVEFQFQLTATEKNAVSLDSSNGQAGSSEEEEPARYFVKKLPDGTAELHSATKFVQLQPAGVEWLVGGSESEGFILDVKDPANHPDIKDACQEERCGQIRGAINCPVPEATWLHMSQEKGAQTVV